MATYDCVEPGCSFKVEYQPELVSYALARKFRSASSAAPRRVYLECPDGHIHVYKIQEESS